MERQQFQVTHHRTIAAFSSGSISLWLLGPLNKESPSCRLKKQIDFVGACLRRNVRNASLPFFYCMLDWHFPAGKIQWHILLAFNKSWGVVGRRKVSIKRKVHIHMYHYQRRHWGPSHLGRNLIITNLLPGGWLDFELWGQLDQSWRREIHISPPFVPPWLLNWWAHWEGTDSWC